MNWSEEVRAKSGKELLRRGMFPSRKYFVGESERMDIGDRMSDVRNRIRGGFEASSRNIEAGGTAHWRE